MRETYTAKHHGGGLVQHECGPQEPVRQKYGELEMLQLSKEVDSLATAVKELSERLCPVVSQSIKCDEKNSECPEPNLPSFINELRLNRKQVAASGALIQEIIRHLEI